ncbi:MAG TPA: four helix bundle protein [Fulvivirga sp.]|nr:four helix bundle protein [Fulvivirga sp.]
MAKIERFEDLNCWKEARELVKLIFITCDNEKLKRDFGLVDQLKRAAISVMNNIAEGFGRYSKKEFIRFLDFSQSSALEVLSMSYVLIDLNYIDKNEFELIQTKTNNTKNLILGLIKYLKTK